MESSNTLTLEETDINKDYSNEFKTEALLETPFTLIQEKGLWFGVIGKHRITEYYDNKEELKKDLEKITWDRLIQVIWAVTEKLTTKD